MTLLDDDIDDLLHAFRADEARLDDATRTRIWVQICDAVPEAPTMLDTLDRGARVRRLRQRVGTRPRARVLAVAAAVLALLAVGGLSIRSGPDDDAVTAGLATTAPVPRDLEELADRVADLPTTTLGADGATYTYRRGIRSIQGSPTSEMSTRVEQQWVALDGSGREIIDVEGDDRDRDQTKDAPDSYEIGFLPPRTAVGLPDDADIVMATFARDAGLGAGDPRISPALVEILTYTGLPAPSRAGVLRALGRLGFAPVPGADLTPNVWRVEGPGPDGSTMQADLDLRTGGVTALARLTPDGFFNRLTSIEVDLRRDTQGS